MARNKDTCNPANRAALDLQLSRLRHMEEHNKTYQEMLASAEARVAARVESAQTLAAQKARKLQKEAEQAEKEARDG